MQIKSGVAVLVPPGSGQRPSSVASPVSSAKDATATSPRGISNYDFTSMTPRQMQSAMNNLIRRGEMSLDDTTGLVSMIPTELSNVTYDGRAPSAYDAPMDFIATLQTAIASALSRGETSNATNLTQTLDTLWRLQGKASSIDVTA